MPSQHRPNRFAFLLLFLISLIMGIGSYWLMSRWLTPQPTIVVIPGLDVHNNDWDRVQFDADARWLCVRKEKEESFPRSNWKVYDLQANGKLAWEYECNREEEYDVQPIDDGIRSLRRSPNRVVEIVERNFARREERVIGPPIQRTSSNLKTDLISQGKFLLILDRWPLWPWRLLASQGHLPLDALFLSNPTTPKDLDHSLPDAMVATLWDVEHGKEHARVFLAPPNNAQLVISNDGKWMVVPEAVKLTDSAFWPNPLIQSRVPSKFIPAEPRGVRIINLLTGEGKILICEANGPGADQPAWADLASIEGDRVRLIYAWSDARHGNNHPDIQISFNAVSGSQLVSYTPFFDLVTGSKIPGPFPPYNNMAQPGWGTSFEFIDRWPTWLQWLGEKAGFSLDVKYPRPDCVKVRFINTANGQTRYLYKLETSNFNHSGPTPNQRGIIIWQETSHGLEIIRWQIPFAVYSPWWALCTGLLFFTLPLAWWVRRNLRSTVVG